MQILVCTTYFLSFIYDKVKSSHIVLSRLRFIYFEHCYSDSSQIHIHLHQTNYNLFGGGEWVKKCLYCFKCLHDKHTTIIDIKIISFMF
jgi:hypothetical protein